MHLTTPQKVKFPPGEAPAAKFNQSQKPSREPITIAYWAHGQLALHDSQSVKVYYSASLYTVSFKYINQLQEFWVRCAVWVCLGQFYPPISQHLALKYNPTSHSLSSQTVHFFNFRFWTKPSQLTTKKALKRNAVAQLATVHVS